MFCSQEAIGPILSLFIVSKLMSMFASNFNLFRLSCLRFGLATFVAAGVALSPTILHAAVPVDAEIMLLVDVSRSVDAKEYLSQRDGYVEAFRDSSLIDEHVTKGHHRRIAVSLIYWSSPGFRQVAVPWTLIDGPASAQAFADAIIKGSAIGDGKGASSRPFDGTTAPGSAIAFGSLGFLDNAFDGSRKIMIVSGDGAENDGIPTAKSRDEAIAKGIDTINTLPIGSETLKNWYIKNIQAGKDAFTVVAKDFPDLPAAIRHILFRTLSPKRH